MKELQKAAEKLLKGNIGLRKEEKIVVVTDRKGEPIFTAIVNAAKRLGGNVRTLYISPKREHSSPIPKAARIFNSSDVIIAPTTKSISHSPETTVARKKYGARVASMPGITQKMFIDAMKVDTGKIKRLNYGLYEKIKGSRFIGILAPSGTHVKLNVQGAEWHLDDCGDISKKGTISNIPFGEVDGYAPKGVGLLFIDFWGKKIKPADRAWVYLQRGKIVKWNKTAEPLVRELRTAGECGLKTVELGIGTNPAFKKPIGNLLQDEKIYGTAHIGFGGHGAKIVCPIHTDVILMHPTIWVDGRKIMEKGRLIKR